jgi:hypothetical protein
MEAFLKALPVAALSTTAYAAYVLTLVAWVVIAWRVRRYRALLSHISALPSRDRLAAIKAEIGVVEIKGGISADQWLRSRLQTYYLVGFGIVCITAFAITAIAFFVPPTGSVTGSIGLGN